MTFAANDKRKTTKIICLSLAFIFRKSQYKSMKNCDKFLSPFPFVLEKKFVKKYYFHPLSPSFLVSKIVICGIWGCHMWHLTRSLVASDSLRSHIWRGQKPQMTTQKHSFRKSKRCKEIGSNWLSTTSKNVNFWPFSNQNLFCFRFFDSQRPEIQNFLDKSLQV